MPAAVAQPPPPPPDTPFLKSTLGMVSTGLVVLVVAAWGVSAIQKKRPAQEQ